jgi:hypothetical protein
MKKGGSLGLSSAVASLRNSMIREARQNAALRASVKSQSAKRANTRAASPPKRKSPSPPKRKSPSPPKRKSPSPPKMAIGARVQLPILITHPNGRIEVKFRTTRKYYAPNSSKPYGYNLSKQVR